MVGSKSGGSSGVVWIKRWWDLGVVGSRGGGIRGGRDGGGSTGWWGSRGRWGLQVVGPRGWWRFRGDGLKRWWSPVRWGSSGSRG